jgi:cysteine desulfurase
MNSRRFVYLDHSASTPTDPRVVAAMLPYFTEVYGNASSSHLFGRDAEAAIENARVTVARVLNCSPDEVIFTSGGSESDNLAIRGVVWDDRQRNRGGHLVTSPIEHSAVSRTIVQLQDETGPKVSVLPVDHFGRVSADDVQHACRPDTSLVSIMLVNNEVGTVEPIAQLAAVARQNGTRFHTDAVQGAGQLSLDVRALGVDLLSLSAHKFYGPKGIGILYVRSGVELVPAQTGGEHEHGLRAGTQATPLIVGAAEALRLAYEEFDIHVRHYRKQRDRLVDRILDRIAGVQLTGHPTERLPGHASFVIDGVESNSLLMHLDMRGVAASSASACKTGNPEPSGVLIALGYSPQEASGSLRLTVGRQTTEADVDYAVEALAESVDRIRKLSRERVL